MEICKSLDIKILNGRCKGDSFGKITFHGQQGISTVDYMIVSHELLDRFQNFVIRQPSPYSDHSQLVGWFKINKTTIKSPTNNSQELFNLPKQFKWSQESKQKFTTALQSSESKEMISDFENTDLETLKDVDMAVNELVKILDFAARKSLQIINIKKKRQHLQKSQPWYDSECKNLKQRLKHISKQKHENPLNENTRINYHFINKDK
jgi:hypothetical protein